MVLVVPARTDRTGPEDPGRRLGRAVTPERGVHGCRPGGDRWCDQGGIGAGRTGRPFPTTQPSSWSTTPPARWPPHDLFASVVAAVRSTGVDGAIPVVPVSDTLKRVDGRHGASTASTATDWSRSRHRRPSWPATLRRAHRACGEATDDAGLLEELGATVRTVVGDPHNVKLTRPEDLVLAEALLRVAGR